MVKKKVYIIKYGDSANIGDNFQSFATKKVLEKLGYDVDYFDRDRKTKLVGNNLFFINGYYSPKTIKGLNFNFPKDSKVIFYNMHLAGDNGRDKFLKDSFLSKSETKEVFNKYAPIGCRDKWTADLLNDSGFEAINNECITLLLDKRTKNQEKNAKKCILVDVDEFIPIPKKFKNNYEYKSQMIKNGEKLSNEEKIKLTEEILEYYKNNAKLVITSRFHCAMPCIAMGIPVVFFGDIRSNRCIGLKKYIPYYDYIHLGLRQTSHLQKLSWSDSVPILNIKVKYDFNILDVIYILTKKFYQVIKYKFFIKINWNVKMPNIEEQKKSKLTQIKTILKGNDW